MTLCRVVAAVLLAAASARASAQLSNRSIAVEAGVSAPASAGAPSAEVLAVAATAWLDGELEAVARLARWAEARTPGRAADGDPADDAGRGGWIGTAGLRLSLLPEPLRPQLWIEAGWARLERPEGPADRLALGAGAGLEWFVARDLSVAARCAVRGAGRWRRLDAVVGLAAYF
jgi:post-segregation antitoxin (ccd killing protein)